jgi:hypothetical protein
MNAKTPYHNIKHMVSSVKKDVGSMKPITLEGEGAKKAHRTLQPLKFRM